MENTELKKSEVQVDYTYYARPRYGSTERFISYQQQMAAIRDSDAKSVLFVGVGDGVVPFYLRNVLGLEVTTCDIDPELNPDLVADIKNLPCEDNAYDAVAVFEVLEHLPYEDFEKCLSEINRVTKKHAFVSIPYRYSGFDIVIKFPFIKTLTNRRWVRLLWILPVKFPGLAVSGQHYWEISLQTSKRKVLKDVAKHMEVISKGHLVMDAYHFFMTLQKKKPMSNAYTEKYYDSFLQDLPGDYKTARWFSSPASKLDFEQTKQVIADALRGVHASRTLEVGPGDGVWTDLIIPKTDSLTLLDQSEEMIKRAQERLAKENPSITFVHSDFAEYQPEAPFDLICGIRCFEYFEDQAKAVKKMYSMLNPGGQLVIVTKNPAHIRARKVQQRDLHVGQISKKEMVQLLESEGFTVTKVLSATFRIKARHAIMRGVARMIQGTHVASGGFIRIPYITHAFTESYIYIAKRNSAK